MFKGDSGWTLSNEFYFIGTDAYLIFTYGCIMLSMAYKNVREEKLTTAFFISGSPIMAAIPAIIPCVMAGNAILVVGVGILSRRIKGNGGLIAGMAAGTVVKSLFMGFVIALILIPTLIPAKMEPMMAVFQTTFSVTQLITAAIGSVYAFIIWIPLKKVMGQTKA